MLHCPHCSSPITLAELRSRRLLRPRRCRSCGWQYFEGGTTAGMTLVGVGGGLATTMDSGGAFPEWAPVAVAFGAALLAVVHCSRTQPRKVGELRPAIRLAVLAGPVGALLVWGVLMVVS